MRGVAGSAGRVVTAVQDRRKPTRPVLTTHCIGAGAPLLAVACAAALTCAAGAAQAAGMQVLRDDELAAVRGADGIAFNLNNFSLTSSTDVPLTLTYLSPGGSSLALSRLDLRRTDDADPFADPYQLDVLARPGQPDMIALQFPLNAAGAQAWSLAADFTHCGSVSLTDNTCTGSTFYGGTLQVSGLAMKGGGLFLAPTALANTQGIAFGFGTRLDIGSIGIYSHGRNAADQVDTGDSLVFGNIQLADAATGGAWMLADLAKHPGLLNAQTDANGSYLHLQIGWPTTADPVPGASLAIGDISFTSTPAGGGAPTVTSLGTSSIASMQINYLDVRLRTGH